MFGTERNPRNIKAIHCFKLFTNVIEKSLVLKRLFVLPTFYSQNKCQPLILLSRRPTTSDPMIILQNISEYVLHSCPDF